jgi:hypothetical protein
MLRWVVKNALLGADATLRHCAKRRRVRTVMQELMHVAARLIHRGRRNKLAFGCPAVPTIRRPWTRLACR